MLEKTINEVISKKINKWIESITDSELQKDIRKETIVTGGAIVSLVQNEEPNDYDIYFKTREMTKRVAKYYCNEFNRRHGTINTQIGQDIKALIIDGHDFKKEEDYILIDPSQRELIEFFGTNKLADGEHKDGKFTGTTRMIACTADTDRIKVYVASDGVVEDNPIDPEDGEVDIASFIGDIDETPAEEPEDKEKKTNKTGPFRPVYLTSNAITLTDGIQLIIRFWGEPEEIHKNYDFIHTRGYWTSWEEKVHISAEVYESIINKRLGYIGSLYPVCSLFRLRKFIQRGWNINAGQILKIAFQISELDLTDIDVLEDQLFGVDSVYFLNLIDELRSNREADDKFQVTQSYVASLVDKIFG